MCILKIHANSHTANAIQSVAHNMDTTISDMATLEILLMQRGHKEDAERVRLALFHAEREQKRLWSIWTAFVEDSSPSNDSLPIGAESVSHSEMYASEFHYSKES